MKAMKYAILLTMAMVVSTTHARFTLPSSDIVTGDNARTYYSQYKGKDLKVGDKVRIMEYDFAEDLKHKRSRKTLPTSMKKVIGEATVSSILNDNYFELKSAKPMHIPEGAFIEKL